MAQTIRPGEPAASDAVPADREVIEDRGRSNHGLVPGIGKDRNRFAIGAGMVAIALTLFIAFLSGGLSLSARKQPEPKATGTPAPATRVTDEGVVAPQLADAARDPNAPVPLAADQVPAIDGQVTAPEGRAAPTAPAKSEAQALREAARRSTLVAYSGLGVLPGGMGLPSADRGEIADDATAQPATDLDRLRRTSTIGRVSAADIGDRNMLIVAGSVIPCVLQTALDSSQPGYTTCLIPRDVYSDNGRVLLLEKGTRVLGEYQGGIQRGRYRLFVMWNRAVTPRGVSIALGSPASDELGRAGMPGGVQSFFWQRFGAAILFSAIDTAGTIGGQAAANAIGGNGVSNVTQYPSQTAQTVVADSQRIQPVLRKSQGEDVSIFVAQDLDFAGVYGLRLRAGR